MKILLDTNFLLIPFKNKIDIYEELRFKYPDYKLITLEACVEELRNKEKGAVDLLEKNNVEIIDFRKGNVDDSILNYAIENKVVVATIDKVLQKRISEKGLSYIFLRQKKFLQFQGGKALKNHQN